MNKEEIKQLATNTANIGSMVEDVRDIKLQVSNHIPTSINALRADMNKKDREQEEKINKTMIQVSGITATIAFLIQALFFFINK